MFTLDTNYQQTRYLSSNVGHTTGSEHFCHTDNIVTVYFNGFIINKTFLTCLGKKLKDQ